MALLPQSDWWHNAIIYQIYIRSFADSDGDGVGDLRGLAQRLPYVRDLGADAIWICPFVRSPMRDFGYDVSDFCAVEPMFGTLKDFDAVVTQAHELGLRVLMDQVWNHTSDQHPWFVQSRADRDNPKADWYVWADPAHDGGPPNNWRATFGGSAWSFDPARRQYYLHNFLEQQPDLNWYNPDVRAALLEAGRFWLERGVDGFRLDVVNFYCHDRSLADNPARSPERARPAGASMHDPYFEHINAGTVSRDETLQMLGHIRELMDTYPGTMTLGEISSAEDALVTASEYVAGNGRLHTAYNSALVSDAPFTASHLRGLIETVRTRFVDGHCCWTLGTHDFPRLKGRWSRYGQHAPELEQRLDQLLLSLLIALPGSCCLYQGDELGLPQAQLSLEQLRDPFGIANWGVVQSRDGCRTPMPWQADAPNCGFTLGTPWLPVPAEHLPLAVDRQWNDKDSLLNAYREVIAWRRTQPALGERGVELWETSEPVLAFVRGHGHHALLCVFNLSSAAAQLPLSHGWHIAETARAAARREEHALELPGFGWAFLERSTTAVGPR